MITPKADQPPNRLEYQLDMIVRCPDCQHLDSARITVDLPAGLRHVTVGTACPNCGAPKILEVTADELAAGTPAPERRS